MNLSLPPKSSQNLTTNAAQQQQQQQGHLAAMAAAHASLLQSSGQNPVVPAPGITNGADCESLLPPPPPASVSSGNSNHGGSNNSNISNNNIPSPHYMPTRDENFKLAQLKRSFDHELLAAKGMPKDKDCGYPGAGPTKLPAHNVQQQHANKKREFWEYLNPNLVSN